MKFLGLKIRDAIPEKYQEAHDLLPKFTVAQFLTDVVVAPARVAAVNAMVTVSTENGVPIASNYPHPCHVMKMLRDRMTSRLPAEQNAEIEKFQAIRVMGGDFEGMIDSLRGQARLLSELGIPMSDPAMRAQICKAIDKHAQPLADTLTSNPELTTEQLIAAFSAHYKTRAVKSGTSKRAAEDAVALCASVPEQVSYGGGRGRGSTQVSGGRGSSRGRSHSRGFVSPRGRGRGGRSAHQDSNCCFSCGRPGHFERNCRFTQESSGENKSGIESLSQPMSNLNITNPIYCTRCGAKGHTEEKCRFTKRVLKLQARYASIEGEKGVDTLMVRVYKNGENNKSRIFQFQFDSAADRHLVPFLEYLDENTVTKFEEPVNVGGINVACPLYATHTGTLRIPLLVCGRMTWENIEEVLVVPNLPCPLISIGFFQEKGYDLNSIGVKGQVAGITHVLKDGQIRLEGIQNVGSARTFLHLADGGEYFKRKLAGTVVARDEEILKNSNSFKVAISPSQIGLLGKNGLLGGEEKRERKKEKD